MVLQQDALTSADSVFLALLQQLAGSDTGATCVCVLQHEDADAGSGFVSGCLVLQQAELVSASVAAAWCSNHQRYIRRLDGLGLTV